MKRLSSERDLRDLTARIRALAPDSPRRWGKMTCPQMVCHLADAFCGPLGDRRPSAPRGNIVSRTVLRWLVIRTPLPFVRGAPTSPEIDQAAGKGTPPAQFAADVARLLAIIERFRRQPNSARPPHPVFGPMKESDWARWGWAHVDHHLRQFGA